MKRFFSLLVLVLIIFIPCTVGAVESNTYAVDLTASIDNGIPTNTQFEFTVKTFIVDDGEGEADEAVATEVLKLDTSKEVKVSYIFKDISGNYRYDVSLTSSSNKQVALDSKTVSFYVNSEEIRVADGKSEQTFEVAELSENIKVNFESVTAKGVKIEPNSDKPIVKVYDGKTSVSVPEDSYKLIGVQNGEDVKLAYTSAVFNSADVKTGNKVTVSGLSLTGNDAAKYRLETEKFDCTGKITVRPITVTADTLVMTVGQTEPELTYKLSEELIDGNIIIGSLARTSGNTAGTYVITRGTLSFGDNYEVTFIEGSLTISNYTLAEVFDSKTGVKVSGYFDKNTSISVRELILTDSTYKTLAAECGKDKKVISAYDVILSSKESDGDITVSFAVDSQYEGKTVYIYQLGSLGSVISSKTAVISGVITLETTECTQFLIATDKPKNEGGSVWLAILKVFLIILGVIVGLALLIVLFFFGMIFFNKTEELKKIIKALKRVLRK
jgi:hypothetical protein